MRIAIDYRMISGGTNVVNRGTGRYTQQQLREVLKLDLANEYLLICHPDADHSLILPEIRAAHNVSIARLNLPGLQRYEQPNRPDRILRHTAQYQEWLYKQRVDLYHATTPYQLDELVLTSFDVCPVVVTLYDLIPMVYPQHYWPYGTPFHEELGHALRFIANADRLLAISESAKSDAQLYLGVPDRRLDIAYPIAEPFFRQLPAHVVATIMGNLRIRLPIPDTFIMSLSHIHHSKNLETLLAAYARLSNGIRQQLPLVIVFFLRDSDKDLLLSHINRYGIAENVILTGLISDDELVALYNAATMIVHPSRYEGFGLPVVEAMQCGAPVITTTASSLPEVGGDAAILVDPDDIQGFADAIAEVLANPARRKEMRRRGLEYVQKFNPNQLGRNTIESYHKALETRQTTQSSERPRVAMWTSLPPLNCGIADYTVELMEYLSPSYDISIFVDDGYLPSADLLQDYSIQHYSSFERRSIQNPFDSIIYQMGVSFMHDYMYDYIRMYPGLVVIHDLISASALYHVYSGKNKLDLFKQQIIAYEGPQAQQTYEELWASNDGLYDQRLEPFFKNHLLLKWVVDNSLAQIVHMEFAGQQLEAHYGHARVFTVNMGVQDPWWGLPIHRTHSVRDSLDLRRSDFITGIFGSVAPIKRIDVCIKSFYELLATHPNSLLLIVGDLVDPAYEQLLRDLVQNLRIEAQVRFVGRASRLEFDSYVLACDIVLNLRYPPKIQMSAILIRAIAAGKPVIISNIPEWSDFPDDFCWRVTPDDSEVATLRDYLRRLAGDPILRQQMSNAARAYFEHVGTLAHMAAQYENIIEQVLRDARVTLIGAT